MAAVRIAGSSALLLVVVGAFLDMEPLSLLLEVTFLFLASFSLLVRESDNANVEAEDEAAPDDKLQLFRTRLLLSDGRSGVEALPAVVPTPNKL
jgi:hypothetical protein